MAENNNIPNKEEPKSIFPLSNNPGLELTEDNYVEQNAQNATFTPAMDTSLSEPSKKFLASAFTLAGNGADVESNKVQLELGNLGLLEEQENQKATADRLAKAKSDFEKAVLRGDSAAASVIAKDIKEVPNLAKGGMERNMVNNLKPTDKASDHFLELQEKKKAYLQSTIAKLDSESGIGDKIKSFALVFLPFLDQSVQTGEVSDYAKNIVTPGSNLEKNVTDLFADDSRPGESVDAAFSRFTKKVDTLKTNMLAQTTLGVFDPAKQLVADKLRVYLEGTQLDSTMISAFTYIDAASLLAGPVKAVASAAKWTKNAIMRTGSIAETAKNLGNSDLVAASVRDVLYGGKASPIVQSEDAAVRNALNIQQPFSKVDGVSTKVEARAEVDQRLNLANQYGDDPMYRQLQDIMQQNTFIGISEEEMALGIEKFKDGLVSKIKSDVDIKAAYNIDNTGRITQDAVIGNIDGSGFATKEEAIKKATQWFDIKKSWSVIDDTDGEFRIKVTDAVDEKGLVTGLDKPLEVSLMEKFLSQPMGRVRDETFKGADTAVTTESKLQKWYGDLMDRNISKMGKEELREVSKVAEHFRGKEMWPSDEVFIDTFEHSIGKAPTERQLGAYRDLQFANDADAIVHNTVMRDRLDYYNVKSYSFKGQSGQLESTLGRVVNDSDDLAINRVWNSDKGRFEIIDTDAKLAKFKEDGYTVIKVDDVVEMQGESVAYAMSKRIEEKQLPDWVLPYKAGGRVVYDADLVAKQPVVTKRIMNGRESYTTHYRTMWIDDAPNAIRSKNAVKSFNKALDELSILEEAKAAGKDITGSVKKLNSLFSDTMYGSLKGFLKAEKHGQVGREYIILGRDRQIPEDLKFSRTLNKQIKSDQLFKPKTVLDQKIQRSMDKIRRGEHVPNSVGQPAALKSPFTASVERFTKDASNFAYNRFLQNEAVRFSKYAAPYLDNVSGDPIQALRSGIVKKDTPTRIKQGIQFYQSYLKGVARVVEKSPDKDRAVIDGLMAIGGVDGATARIRYEMLKAYEDASPKQFTKNWFYRIYFSSFSQALLQGSYATVPLMAVADHPLIVGKSIKDFWMTATHAIRKNAGDAAELEKIYAKFGEKGGNKSRLYKDWDESGLGIIDFNFTIAADKIKATTKGSIAESNKLAGAAESFSSKVDKGFEYATTFARGGEQAGRLMSFTVARNKLLSKSGKYGAWAHRSDKMDKITREQYIKDLRAETDRLAAGQTRANQIWFQRAAQEVPGGWGAVIEVATQFFQFTFKMLDNMMPAATSRLGFGNKGFSGKEKLLIAGVGTAIFGADWIPGGDFIRREAWVVATKMGMTDLSYDEWRLRSDGLLANLYHKVTGLMMDPSRFSPASGPVDIISTLIDPGNRSTLSSFVAGSSIISAVKRYTNYKYLEMADRLGYDEEARLELMRTHKMEPAFRDKMKALAKAALDVFPLSRDLKNTIEAYSNDDKNVAIYSNAGTLILRRPFKVQLLSMLGVPPADLRNHYDNKALEAGLKTEDIATELFRAGWKEYYRATAAGDNLAAQHSLKYLGATMVAYSNEVGYNKARAKYSQAQTTVRNPDSEKVDQNIKEITQQLHNKRDK